MYCKLQEELRWGSPHARRHRGGDMDITTHIDVVEQEGQRFAAASRAAGLDATVPSCPGWDVRELVRHLSEIHLWAAAQVTRRATKMWPDGLDDIAAWWPDLAEFWPDDDRLVDFYLATNENLVTSLREADPDVEARTFLPAPSPLAMWARRQAHELTIHRVDAEEAGRSGSVIDADVASDGIDELLMAFAPRPGSVDVDRTSTVAVRANDTHQQWHITISPDGFDTSRADAPADAVVDGTAADLYVALWNRGDDSAIRVAGDEQAFMTWHQRHRLRWS